MTTVATDLGFRWCHSRNLLCSCAFLACCCRCPPDERRNTNDDGSEQKRNDEGDHEMLFTLLLMVATSVAGEVLDSATIPLLCRPVVLPDNTCVVHLQRANQRHLSLRDFRFRFHHMPDHRLGAWGGCEPSIIGVVRFPLRQDFGEVDRGWESHGGAVEQHLSRTDLVKQLLQFFVFLRRS